MNKANLDKEQTLATLQVIVCSLVQDFCIIPDYVKRRWTAIASKNHISLAGLWKI